MTQLKPSPTTTCCTVCAYSHLHSKIDFGSNPPANRFLSSDQHREDRFSLTLGYCPQCETIQLTQQMPKEAVQPRFPWLSYNEPEGHLDDAVSQICKLPGVGPSTSVLGLTYKDQSTLDRLTRRGITQSSCLSYTIFQPLALCQDTPVDLLIARHIVEHAHSAAQFISELKSTIAPNGYLIIEIPDSEKLLKWGNHGFIWEEHISYFTEHSLHTLASQVGAKLIWSQKYPYPYEDSLMAAFQFTSSRDEEKEQHSAAVEFSRGSNDQLLSHVGCKSNDLLDQFHRDFITAKTKWRERLVTLRNQGYKLAVFGAGHLAVKWINFLQLADLFDCVIDDHPHKVGMFMPGSKLPILSSEALVERGIQICISTLSPETEQKVKIKLAKYFDAGGFFIHAFHSSSHAQNLSSSEA